MGEMVFPGEQQLAVLYQTASPENMHARNVIQSEWVLLMDLGVFVCVCV